MDQNELVIVMCTYNGAKYIDEQIASIVGQDYTSWQLYISDDCSTDGTIDKIQSWITKYPNKIILHRNEKNVGYNKNFNQAFMVLHNLFNASFVAVADQDDIWLPEKLSTQVDYLKNNPKVSLLHHADFKKKGSVVYYENDGNVKWLTAYEGDDIRCLLFRATVGHTIIFKTSLLKYYHLPEGIMYDRWLGIVASLYGFVKYINKPLTIHRLHETNSFHNKNMPSIFELQKRDVAVITSCPIIPKRYINFFTKYIDMSEKKFSREKIHSNIDTRYFLFLLRYRYIIFGSIWTKNPFYREALIWKRCYTWAKY